MIFSSKHDTPSWDQVIVDVKDYVFNYQVTRPEILEKAREVILDSIGCAILAVNTSEECRSLLGPYVPGTSVANGCRLPGTSIVQDPVKGAWDLASLIRWLDYNDCIGGVDWGHISDNLGSIITVCDWLARSKQPRSAGAPPLTMRTLLEAIVKAAEIQGTFNVLNSFNKLGLDHTVLVKLASTAVVSWLMGSNEEQTMAAISHVFMDSCPLRVFRAGSNTIPRKAWAAGDACSRAVQLALIVRAGQPGAPTVLTMRKWGFYENIWRGQQFAFPLVSKERDASSESKLASPFQTYIMERVAFKLNPCEGHALYAIEAMLDAGRQLRGRGLDPFRDIKSIKLRACRPIVLILDKPGELYNYADRDHSIQYVLGVTLLKGSPPETHDYSDDSLWASSPELRETRAKFQVIEDPGFTAEYYANSRGEPSPPVAGVTLVLSSGEVMEEAVARTCPGVPANPKTADGVRTKFLKNMKSGNFSDQAIRNIVDLVYQDDASVSHLVDLLVK
ncbi:2-methylcitrate dehydratase PrpD [Cryphonectria parasitica EP155]|uniref:2-methylcitrate dehydratase PrpD n=1 Tax=Cryphonectria parasitica (strain ATCC 38755 / EP155) TaxID=660469 RepID=A0A9P4XXT4_CRYP1|nr:2-methylcitrate dehydratase PrpD [Cryphonectria parasitica EP155]KAF3762836.1 2-methylcitrate dehydratase PrpD [Cryphonectria parasitica EP155]